MKLWVQKSKTLLQQVRWLICLTQKTLYQYKWQILQKFQTLTTELSMYSWKNWSFNKAMHLQNSILLNLRCTRKLTNKQKQSIKQVWILSLLQNIKCHKNFTTNMQCSMKYYKNWMLTTKVTRTTSAITQVPTYLWVKSIKCKIQTSTQIYPFATATATQSYQQPSMLMANLSSLTRKTTSALCKNINRVKSSFTTNHWMTSSVCWIITSMESWSNTFRLLQQLLIIMQNWNKQCLYKSVTIWSITLCVCTWSTE